VRRVSFARKKRENDFQLQNSSVLRAAGGRRTEDSWPGRRRSLAKLGEFCNNVAVAVGKTYWSGSVAASAILERPLTPEGVGVE